MLKYHGTPITPKAQLDTMQGRNFCVPYPRPDNLAHCLRIGQSLMLDNGAFSVKTRGEVFDLHGFYAWIDPILAHPHWAFVLLSPNPKPLDVVAQIAWLQLLAKVAGGSLWAWVLARTAQRATA